MAVAQQFVPRRTPPKPPTMEEMQVRLPGLKFYNPSDDWVPMEVHGITIFAVPDKGGVVEAHPADGTPTVCDGVSDIKGRVLNWKDSSGKKVDGQDAYSRMTYLIHKERFGEMGICWLPGQDENEDAQHKAFAKEQWLKYQQIVDDKVIERRREFVANWRKNPAKQGTKVPPPSERENAAIERSELRERVKSYDYECQVGDCIGYASNKWEKFVGHMAAAHNITVTRNEQGYTLTNPDGSKLKVGEALALSPQKRTLTPEALEVEDAINERAAEKESAIEAAAERVGMARGAPRRKARA
jgi:hypothetical protein